MRPTSFGNIYSNTRMSGMERERPLAAPQSATRSHPVAGRESTTSPSSTSKIYQFLVDLESKPNTYEKRRTVHLDLLFSLAVEDVVLFVGGGGCCTPYHFSSNAFHHIELVQ